MNCSAENTLTNFYVLESVRKLYVKNIHGYDL